MSGTGSGESAGGSPALRVEGLRKSFGANEVLRGIDLTVASHEVIGLIGASGSGKSTLLRCVNLLERIDAGAIYLDGQLITGPASARCTAARSPRPDRSACRSGPRCGT